MDRYRGSQAISSDSVTKAHCPSSGCSWGSDLPEFPENLYYELKNKDEEVVYDEPVGMEEVPLDDSSVAVSNEGNGDLEGGQEKTTAL